MSLAACFIVEGRSRTKGSFRHIGRGRLVPDGEFSAGWERWSHIRAREAWGGKPLLAGPVQMSITFTFAKGKTQGPHPITRRGSGDLDKLSRTMLDALTGAVYVDDSQVVKLTALKVWGADACAQVMVAEYTGAE